MFFITQSTGSTHGMPINSVCNPSADIVFLERLKKSYRKYFKQMFPDGIDSSQRDQRKFVSLVEESISDILSKDCEYSVYWDTVDWMGRPHKRLYLKDRTNRWEYVVDVFADLTMHLVIPFYKRLWYKYISRKTYFVRDEDVLPIINHRIRLWRTPNDRYDIQLTKCPMKHIDYLKSDYARNRVGLPVLYRIDNEVENEQLDYYCRRSLFGERVNIGIS